MKQERERLKRKKRNHEIKERKKKRCSDVKREDSSSSRLKKEKEETSETLISQLLLLLPSVHHHHHHDLLSPSATSSTVSLSRLILRLIMFFLLYHREERKRERERGEIMKTWMSRVHFSSLALNTHWKLENLSIAITLVDSPDSGRHCPCTRVRTIYLLFFAWSQQGIWQNSHWDRFSFCYVFKVCKEYFRSFLSDPQE